MRIGACGAAFAAACVLAFGGASAGARPAPAPYAVGAAKADITPTDLNRVQLGGYGIGPVHPAKGVLRPIYARAIALRDARGHQAVIAALDLQGHFLAYQQGPYGFADIATDMQHKLGLAPDHLLIQATHTHNGPDDLGAWGGVPDAYLAYVKRQTESAIERAVASEQPARLRYGTADMTGFSGTFGSNTDSTNTGDQRDYPIDQQLRVLQARNPHGRVIATLVNYSSHPTVYGPLDKVSPDWPGATATFLEHAERNIARGMRYGYPGSTAVVTIGAVGHTWPAGTPRGTDPAVDPPANSDNGPADIFGNAVAREAIAALAKPASVRGSRVGGAEQPLDVANTNAALLALNQAPVPGYHLMRATAPPYGYGDVFATRAVALRIGNLPFFSSPGEANPSVHASLAGSLNAPVTFMLSLSYDQLGYIGEPSDYQAAAQCSAGDEFFFTISPLFGTQLEQAQQTNARSLGFATSAAVPGPGPLPPSTNCVQQQFSQGGLGLPLGTPGLPSLPVKLP